MSYLAPQTPTVVPPVVYLPLTSSSTPQQQNVEVRELRDGRRALLAYTALDRLLELAGPEQPWTLVRTEGLGQLKAQQPFDVVVFDLEVPEMFRRNGAIA